MTTTNNPNEMVFGTPELLESILPQFGLDLYPSREHYDLRPQAFSRLHCVNKTFRATIDGLPALQQLLWLTPAIAQPQPQPKPWLELNDDIVANPMLFCNYSKYISKYDSRPDRGLYLDEHGTSVYLGGVRPLSSQSDCPLNIDFYFNDIPPQRRKGVNYYSHYPWRHMVVMQPLTEGASFVMCYITVEGYIRTGKHPFHRKAVIEMHYEKEMVVKGCLRVDEVVEDVLRRRASCEAGAGWGDGWEDRTSSELPSYMLEVQPQ